MRRITCLVLGWRAMWILLSGSRDHPSMRVSRVVWPTLDPHAATAGREGGLATDSFVVDGRIDDEKLYELLQLQSERGALDYKSEAYDLSSLPSKLEFVKDCAGMLSQPDGGYLVLGVDKHGKPVAPPGVPEPHNFDDGGQLRPILAKYLDGDFEVRAQTHVIDGTNIVLIYVGPVGDGLPIVIKVEGQHTENKKQVVVVRRGEVIIREGTLHRPLTQADLLRLMHRREEAIRQEERARIDGIVEAVRASSVGTQIAHGPLAAITWQLPEDEFSNTILELVRQRDAVALSVAVSGAEADAMYMLGADDGSIDDLMIVLNRWLQISGRRLAWSPNFSIRWSTPSTRSTEPGISTVTLFPAPSSSQRSCGARSERDFSPSGVTPCGGRRGGQSGPSSRSIQSARATSTRHG